MVVKKDVWEGFYILIFVGVILMFFGGASKDSFAIALGTTLVSVGFSIIAIALGRESCNAPTEQITSGAMDELKELRSDIKDIEKALEELKETLQEFNKKE